MNPVSKGILCFVALFVACAWLVFAGLRIADSGEVVHCIKGKQCGRSCIKRTLICHKGES